MPLEHISRKEFFEGQTHSSLPEEARTFSLAADLRKAAKGHSPPLLAALVGLGVLLPQTVPNVQPGHTALETSVYFVSIMGLLYGLKQKHAEKTYEISENRHSFANQIQHERKKLFAEWAETLHEHGEICFPKAPQQNEGAYSHPYDYVFYPEENREKVPLDKRLIVKTEMNFNPGRRNLLTDETPKIKSEFGTAKKLFCTAGLCLLIGGFFELMRVPATLFTWGIMAPLGATLCYSLMNSLQLRKEVEREYASALQKEKTQRVQRFFTLLADWKDQGKITLPKDRSLEDIKRHSFCAREGDTVIRNLGSTPDPA